MKKTEIELTCGRYSKAFSLEQANRLLSIKNGSWKLPENSKYELTENGIVKRANRKESSGEEKGGDDK
ncbi:MAG: hypothetical protein LBP67_05035 [Bacteroidales bacterium]|jgi:hypothetical protein|nr:hypothetical protein [Bacteroidales bacterium]